MKMRLMMKKMVADSVTGNASGSYTFHAWQAEENICHNFDLLSEAIEEFGGKCDVLKDGAEACDVTIRCYLLSEVTMSWADMGMFVGSVSTMFCAVGITKAWSEKYERTPGQDGILGNED